MSEAVETALTSIVTTDLAGITRGRSVPAERLQHAAGTGVGWVPANIALTPFGGIADPNPWGSTGDLRLLPDLQARYRTDGTGSATPFDIVMADIVELDGTPWRACPRHFLCSAVAACTTATGLQLRVAFEHEFLLGSDGSPAAHPFSVEALRPATMRNVWATETRDGIDTDSPGPCVAAAVAPNTIPATPYAAWCAASVTPSMPPICGAWPPDATAAATALVRG